MNFDDCACHGNTLDRLLRPSVMAVLARTPGGQHGYRIAQSLREVAIFGDCPPDSAGLYRALKSMEEEGYLKSDWHTEGTGPAKRVYSLTPAGWSCLRHWLTTLEAYTLSLQETVDYLRESVRPSLKRRKAQ